MSISSASGSKPGAITPSETSLLIIFAVAASHTSERAIKSPKDDILSAPLALAYAQARGESSPRGRPTAAPAGDTCLKDAAAGSPVAFLSSFTSCQPFKASRKLIYPGFPLRTVTGSSPFSIYILAGFWLGLQPYLSASSFIFKILPSYLFLFIILVS